jgi:hypothetical protein
MQVELGQVERRPVWCRALLWCGLRAARVVGSAASSNMLFMLNMLFGLLLSDTLMRVSGQTPNTIDNHASYQACITSPSTCVSLCVPSPPPHALPCRSSAAVLARGSGGRERLDTSPWMVVTVLPRRSCAGETRVAPGRTALSRCG